MKPCFENASPRRRAAPRIEPHARTYRYVRLRWHFVFALFDALGALAVALAGVFRRRRTSVPNGAQCDPDSLLLVQLDHLGDALVTTCILGALRDRYPHARLDVLASPWNCEVFQACALVDRVHVLHRNRFSRSFRLGWPLALVWKAVQLRSERYEVAVDIRGEFPNALLLWLCGAPRRVGWGCGGGGFLLTDRADYVPGRPEVESRARSCPCWTSRKSRSPARSLRPLILGARLAPWSRSDCQRCQTRLMS